MIEILQTVNAWNNLSSDIEWTYFENENNGPDTCILHTSYPIRKYFLCPPSFTD